MKRKLKIKFMYAPSKLDITISHGYKKNNRETTRTLSDQDSILKASLFLCPTKFL